MITYKTLHRGDSQFLSYLLGSFSQYERALPVESLNINSDQESVTFKIVSLDAIDKVHPLRMWFEILKIKSLPLVLVPALLVALKTLSSGLPIDILSYGFAVIGTIFLYFGLNLRNDFVDYVRGTDRWHLDSSARPLQRGWMTAQFCHRLSWFFLTLSLLASLPIYFWHPAVLWVVGVSVILALVSRAFFQNSYKFKLFYEFYLFLFIGPALFFGLQLAAGTSVDRQLLFLSVVWGWLGIFFVYLRYFRNIVTNDHFQLVNTINWFGFERAKYFLSLNWGAFLALYFVYHSLYFGYFATLLTSFGIVAVSLPAISHLIQLRSPMGSEHTRNHTLWYWVFAFTTLFWLLQEYWIYLEVGGA